MADTSARTFRFDWLVVTLLIGAIGFYAGWKRGVRSLDVAASGGDGADYVQPTGNPPEPLASTAETLPAPPDGELALDAFFRLLDSPESKAFEAAVRPVRDGWRVGYTPMLIEVARFSGPSHQRRWLMSLLDELTGQHFEGDFDAAWRWVWSQEPEPHPQYGSFKAELYRRIDPRFAAYFDDYTEQATIRLDEVRWGGVRRDGIPPLDRPKMVAADSPDAAYLDDTHVVFGLEVNGDARAYPKRILAWHEMFKDVVGPPPPEGGPDNRVSVNGVYCTLCGSMIVYETVVGKVHHELGTSGFLYRSNKLMYDHATESMWSTITGEPVVGPLVGMGIKLPTRSVVTTTWGEWKRQHPDTAVLSLDTGYRRDYGEGVAYRNYFATDELMFVVPELDTRLKNKDEVLALRFGGDDTPPAAIDTKLLATQPVYHGTLGDTAYVVLTTPAGANRVYAAGPRNGKVVRFTAYDGDATATSSGGRTWTVTEDALTAADGQTLERLPAHRAFWFGWYAAHPDTVLIR